MARKLFLIGGGGYIGSRFLEKLALQGGHPYKQIVVYDPNIYRRQLITPQRTRWYRSGVEKVSNARIFAGADVVYFAGFHKEPDDIDRFQRERWEHTYRQLMVKLPKKICEAALDDGPGSARFVYVSSMRVLTDDSLYAKTKTQAELEMLRAGGTVVRFGTVWGGFHAKLPNRLRTAVNYALYNEQFTGDHWWAYTTHMATALAGLDMALDAEANGMGPSTIHNFTDTGVPLDAELMRALLANRMNKDAPILQSKFTRERKAAQALSPMEDESEAFSRLRLHYGLEA